MPQRPQNEEELQRQEAIGVIRASRFVRKFARSNDDIDMTTVCAIHKEMFHEAWPEIAGVYRTENLEITDSRHLPPHHSQVPALMDEANAAFVEKLHQLKKLDGEIMANAEVTDEISQDIDALVEAVAWIHHKITFIHPFREGNGRTARLAANLVLERYGLVGISIKVEKENKNRYRQALAQIDAMEDYEPLKNIIYEGLVDRYNGVSLKYYSD
jgi:fido (protein-threonine AMPylation protein)